MACARASALGANRSSSESRALAYFDGPPTRHPPPPLPVVVVVAPPVRAGGFEPVPASPPPLLCFTAASIQCSWVSWAWRMRRSVQARLRTLSSVDGRCWCDIGFRCCRCCGLWCAHTHVLYVDHYHLANTLNGTKHEVYRSCEADKRRCGATAHLSFQSSGSQNSANAS